eukprot:CAMPEP_0114499168 /NCGR_PEP_ID=MMETSP0109-20121206/7271_1 /TAXON_ID=29199 /ORGANISM="Chlorarachnion reptans, Strain CCCM449" /LENGTH=445 /DNA_ID=CAMNT_0001676713 /DNA_START=200 /DNA_END=1537 /DNA_ORIENTATION=+
MTNMIIGAGVLALPFAFCAAGVIPALLICCAVWMASSYSFMLLARCAEATQRFSYKGVALETYGPFAATFSEGAILIYTMGNLIGRQIILGDLLPPLMRVLLGEGSLYAQRGFVLASTTCFLLLPVSLSPYIDSLKWSSLFGLCCMCYVVCLFIARFTGGLFSSGTVNVDDVRMAHSSFLSLMAFPLLVVSFTAHYNIMSMYWELKERSIEKMQFVVSSSTGICLAVYIVVGVSGYMLFMDDTQPNILVNFWTDKRRAPDGFVSLAFIAISLAVSLSFPLVCHGARNSLKKLCCSNPYMNSEDIESGVVLRYLLPCVGDADENGWLNNFLVTSLIIFISFVVGLYIPDIGVIFAFMGSTVGVCFVYILPGLFYIKVHQMEEDRRAKGNEIKHMPNGGKLKDKALASAASTALSASPTGALALIFFGVFIGLVGTIATSLHVSGFI